MSQTPPTLPGPLPPPRPLRANPILRGMVIHAVCVVLTCFIVPLAMNSNIWPIAGVFWSVLTVPVAAGTGALTGWLPRGVRPPLATGLLVVTGLLVATAVGVVMANNR